MAVVIAMYGLQAGTLMTTVASGAAVSTKGSIVDIGTVAAGRGGQLTLFFYTNGIAVNALIDVIVDGQVVVPNLLFAVAGSGFAATGIPYRFM